MTDEIAEEEPFAPFARWFELAAKSEPLAETVTLATATREGMPSLRAVLLKGADPAVLSSTPISKAARPTSCSATRHAALCLHWKSIARQIRIEGTARARLRRRGRCLFCDPAPRQPDRRLGLRPVAAARKPRGARTALSDVHPAICRAACRAAAAQLVRASACAPSGSSSGRSGRIGCMIGSCSFARARHGARSVFSRDATRAPRSHGRCSACDARDLCLAGGRDGADRRQIRRLDRDGVGRAAVEPGQLAGRRRRLAGQFLRRAARRDAGRPRAPLRPRQGGAAGGARPIRLSGRQLPCC